MSTELGQRAEGEAAQYLEDLGMKILARNWRNRWCEIDIITRDKSGGFHFVEVKQRKSAAYGSGFEYITKDKMSRLQRAAQVWMGIHYANEPFQIDVISITAGKLEYLENAM